MQAYHHYGTYLTVSPANMTSQRRHSALTQLAAGAGAGFSNSIAYQTGNCPDSVLVWYQATTDVCHPYRRRQRLPQARTYPSCEESGPDQNR
jgi:hypothetical protein